MKTALLILVFHSAVFAQGVSLGDAARQERARQKNSTGNLKVTNETLGTAEALPPGTEPAKPEAEAGTGTAKSADAKPTGNAEAKPNSKSDVPQDEAGWREAFKQAREDAKRAEDRTKVLQVELNQLNLDLLTRSDIFNREGQLAPLINAKNKELAESEKAVIDANQKITDLDRQLRQSGAPIGWSR